MAALAKLNTEISIEDLLKGTREVDEASRASRTKFTAEEFRECKSTPAPCSISGD